MTKHIFVTGGVASSLGKGLTASSLGRLLKGRGLRVTMQKLDPYLNVDPGTMNPFEHGEVFVTDDGGETDLDLGPLRALHRRAAQPRLQRHDRLDLLGGASPPSAGATTSARPCRSSRTSPTRSSAASPAWPPTTSTSSSPRSAAPSATSRSSRSSRPSGSSASTSAATTSATSTSPWCRSSARPGEQKTKPTQHSVTELRSRGIQPDAIVCRSEAAISAELKRKISELCDVPVEAVVNAADARNLYEVPAGPARRGPRRRACASCSGSATSTSTCREWEILVDRVETADRRRCASASSASTSPCPTPTCRWSSRSSTAASTTAPRSRSSGSRPRTSRACWPRAACTTSTAS